MLLNQSCYLFFDSLSKCWCFRAKLKASVLERNTCEIKYSGLYQTGSGDIAVHAWVSRGSASSWGLFTGLFQSASGGAGQCCHWLSKQTGRSDSDLSGCLSCLSTLVDLAHISLGVSTSSCETENSVYLLLILESKLLLYYLLSPKGTNIKCNDIIFSSDAFTQGNFRNVQFSILIQTYMRAVKEVNTTLWHNRISGLTLSGNS